MKKLVLALVAVGAILLPSSASADTAPIHAHVSSFHHNIDWD